MKSQTNFEQEDEVFASDYSMSAQDQYFVEVVEILQESLLDDNFDDIQTNFMKNHCFVFESEEENKLQQMEVFLKYQQKVQSFIQKKLQQKAKGLTLQDFMKLSEDRAHLADEQFLEEIQSFVDFQHFKKLALVNKEFYMNEANLKDLSVKGNKKVQ